MSGTAILTAIIEILVGGISRYCHWNWNTDLAL